MQIEQQRWSAHTGWTSQHPQSLDKSAQLVFLFGGLNELQASDALAFAHSQYPKAHVVGCTTAGEIEGTTVSQNSVAMTAVAFRGTRVAVAHARIENPDEAQAAAEELVSALRAEDLRHVLVFSDGIRVNGSRLVRGIASLLPPDVTFSGGFAADGDRMSQTHVWCDGLPEQAAAVAIGLYGNALQVRTAVTGAWAPFGPDRRITRAKGETLYELDGRPALAIYKEYLGDYAAKLPASGLLFPLLIHAGDSEQCVLRAPLGIDESEQSIRLGAEIPEGSYARLTRGTVEHLIEDTFATARAIRNAAPEDPPELSLVVSCLGRKQVMKQRLEEELEAAQEVLGGRAMTGFYSHGEIGPLPCGATELHNESLAITAFSEA